MNGTGIIIIIGGQLKRLDVPLGLLLLTFMRTKSTGTYNFGYRLYRSAVVSTYVVLKIVRDIKYSARKKERKRERERETEREKERKNHGN